MLIQTRYWWENARTQLAMPRTTCICISQGSPRNGTNRIYLYRYTYIDRERFIFKKLVHAIVGAGKSECAGLKIPVGGDAGVLSPKAVWKQNSLQRTSVFFS